MSERSVPRFFLYGEPPQEPAARFLHVEALAERSGPSHWKIRPHAHGDLHHVFHITRGGVDASFDGVARRLKGPFLLLAPAGIVHEFAWDAGSDGSVLTVANSYVRELAARDPQLSGVFQAAAGFEVAEPEIRASGLHDAMARLFHETVWDAPGHASAVEGHLLVILVAALRLAQNAVATADLGPQAFLVTRFRDAVERRFRTQQSIADYAADLGVTTKQLRTACVKIAGKPPLQIIRLRTALEARRLLIYSTMTISEVGYSLGFEDPAYFSRFILAEEGVSPREFRTRWRQAVRAETTALAGVSTSQSCRPNG